MKTVLLVSNVSTGLINFRHELIETLLEENRVVILASDTGRVDECKSMGCEYYELPMNTHGINPLTEIGLVINYKKIIKKIAPDIVLTYTIKPNIYAGMVCASLGIPYITNITGLGTSVENNGLMQKITLPLYKYGLRKAQKVFFQNKANMEFMVNQGIVNGPYELIPGSGVNLERFPLLEYPSNSLEFVFMARIIKEKGIDQYLEAAKYIRNKYPETRFHVCGTCNNAYESILKELHDNETIIYHGLISDVVSMHSISCCTVHPTYYPEGMSNVILESCACGRPVITTNRPGCREIVEDGINGFLVKERDSIGLIRQIEHFISLSWEERKKMGLAARAKVEREFDRQIVINRYLEEIG